tara:strand:- start:1016 stop:1531 length:516 start_codon:yes stop_codon:yes gene_type:complete
MTEAVEINEGWVNEMIENGSLASLSDSEEDESVAQTIDSINEETKKRRRVSDMVKKSDPGYHFYYILKNKIKIKIEVYSTSCNVRSLIRCPFTGIRTGDRVGTKDEEYYFKVRDAVLGSGDAPVTLYYTTPESYERHHFVSLPQSVKNEWHKKRGSYNPSHQKKSEFIEIH